MSQITSPNIVDLSADEQEHIFTVLHKGENSARVITRARILTKLVKGHSNQDISLALDVTLTPQARQKQKHGTITSTERSQTITVINGALSVLGRDRLGYTRFRRDLTGFAIAIAVGGCGSVPNLSDSAAFNQFREATSLISAEQASDVSIYAVGLVGTPYRYGGNTPIAGFDCSGLIGYVYQTQAEMKAPRTVNRLQAWGQLVSRDNARAGDLVLFTQDKTATHAGIYVGKGRFVHAPSTGGEVRLDHLNSKYWSSQQVSFRRP